MTDESTKAVEVFYSYAHKDEKLRTALVEHLSTLRRQGYISEWYDRRLVAGTDWAQEIDTHLRSASLILLLISPSFMASDYCYGSEMQLALERHQAGQARVIPIILRPTDLKETPFAALQYLPAQGKAITTWQNRDEAFLNVARGIRTVIENLTSSAANIQPPAQSQAQPLRNIPYPRNLLFTGREHILERLATMFRIGETSASTQPLAISGLGGIGKTQTAIEYAYRYREQYRQVLWARADTRENLVQEYVAIARLLQLPEQHLQEQPQIVEAVKRWLRAQRQWLLILDYADDLGMVRDYLPEAYTGHILLTTRTQAMRRLARRIELDRMEQEEGVLFLLRRVGILEAEESLDRASARDQDTALAIVQEMDGLPLALDQAGAYIEETACGLSGYLNRYQQRRIELLNERGENTYDHPESVATTWSLSFEKVEQANQAAADLLRLCAFLAPDAIPEEIITTGAADLTPVLQALASDPFQLDAAIKGLLRYSLIQRDAEEELLSLHRLVQAVIKEGMDQQAQRQWAERAICAVRAALPTVEHGNWSAWERIVAHAQARTELLERYGIQLPEASELLQQAGSYLTERARYDEAEPLLMQAHAMSEQEQGPEHLDTARDADTLATLYRAQGKYEQAEPLFMRALAIREMQLGPEHPDTADSIDFLAELFSMIEGFINYEQAEPLYQRALLIREQQLGEMHPDTAFSYHHLAELSQLQGKYEQAEPLYQRALAIRERLLGPDHFITAQSLSGLAYIYSHQGKYEQAELLYQHTLKIFEKTLPPDDPGIANILENYASLLRKMNRDEAAATLEERVRVIRASRSS